MKDLPTNIAILGIAYDAKSSYLRGPALAPPLIRSAFQTGASNLWAENGEFFGARPDVKDLGDIHPDDYDNIEIAVEEALADECRLLVLGGDHSITYPIIKAHKRHYDAIHILHIDAHADLYDELDGDRFSHACPFARIMESNLADRLVQVGIRTLNKHQRDQVRRFGVECYEMKDFAELGRLTFDQPVYISLDLDAIDPAFAPGVSHHEAGGFSTRQVIEIIQSIKAPIMGADIVEYNPTRDVSNITAALAAKLMKEILSVMVVKNSGVEH